VNAVSWGYAIREVVDPQLTMGFLFKLVFNGFFILAIGATFMASLLSYAVISELGVLTGRFFLSLSVVATILVATLILGEHLTSREWARIALIVGGILLMGRL